MSKGAAGVAEKAVRKAVEEETAIVRADLTAQLNTALARVAELERAIGSMRVTAENVLRMIAPQTVLPLIALPVAEPEPLPTGPEVDLAEEDQMGEGRWA